MVAHRAAASLDPGWVAAVFLQVSAVPRAYLPGPWGHVARSGGFSAPAPREESGGRGECGWLGLPAVVVFDHALQVPPRVVGVPGGFDVFDLTVDDRADSLWD